MVLLRLISLILIVLALMLIGADGVSSLEKGEVVLRSLAEVVLLAGFDLQTWLQMTLPESVAAALAMLIGLPGWAVMGVIGVVFGALSAIGSR